MTALELCELTDKWLEALTRIEDLVEDEDLEVRYVSTDEDMKPRLAELLDRLGNSIVEVAERLEAEEAAKEAEA
jgi:hypothetical protein